MARKTQPVAPEPSIHYRMPAFVDLPSKREEMALLGLPVLESTSETPNAWFAAQFPRATEKFGPAFLEGTWSDMEQREHTTLAHLNSDFFACLLGGDPRLGHQVIYCPQEDTFYYYDPRVNAFCPTTEDKLTLLLSNYLIRCSQACNRLVNVLPLVTTFREQKILNEVIHRAKALLQADSSFFAGKDGHRRYIDGRYLEPTDQPSYRLFVKTALVRDPDARVTLSEVYSRYHQFCGEIQSLPLARSEFKAFIKEIVREEFNLGFRHDVPGLDGKQTHGWYGINCRLPVPSSLLRN